MPSTKRGRIPLAEPRRDAVLDATVQQFMRDAAGDPRLTWWEENFLASMAAWVAPDGPGAHRLTTKQWTIIAQITAKIEAPLVDDSADSPEDIETAPEDSQTVEDIEPQGPRMKFFSPDWV
jgi:hypothetical protein